jgi:hypothetical protein
MMQSYYVRKTFSQPDGYRERMYNADACDVELNRLRERVEELESANAHCHEGMQKLSEKVVRLLEAVRWCLENGVKFNRADMLGPSMLVADMVEITPPAHLAPLIAEAVKQQKEQSNGT